MFDDLGFSQKGFASNSKFTLKYWAGVIFLSVLYFSTAKMGLMLGAVGGVATPIWPPTGISLAALLLFGYRFWPGIRCTFIRSEFLEIHGTYILQETTYCKFL